MKFVLQLTTLAVFLTFSACQRNAQPIGSSTGAARQAAVSPESQLRATWKLKNFRGYAVKEKQFGPKWPVLTLNPADSSVTGTGGCNSLRGRIMVDGERIKFGPAVMTKMACTSDSPLTEDDFVKLLEGVDSYSFVNNQLVLRREGKPEMTFTKED